MERLYFIVNPVSGSGNGAKRFETVRALLDAKKVNYGYAVSAYPGPAAVLARPARSAGETRAVAAGGDGTTREAASVLADAAGVTFGMLPFGTGNDFARGVGLPEEEAALTEILLKGSTRLIDAGDANGDFFINVAGFGFDVDVVRYTEKYKKSLNGMLPYMLGILQALLHLARTQVHVQTEEGDAFDVTAILFSACNGSRFAGGIRLAPLADCSDGLLDVCILKKVNRLRFLYLLPFYVKGKHLKFQKDFLYFKARSVTAATVGHAPLDLDGEIIGQAPVTFRARPGALRLLVGD